MKKRDTQVQKIKSEYVPRLLILASLGAMLFYFSWWLDISHAGWWVLYVALLIGEIYHIWQSLSYLGQAGGRAYTAGEQFCRGRVHYCLRRRSEHC